jgi:predicted nucleotidyltransferase
MSEVNVDKITEYLPEGKEVVAITEVGSGMWGMRSLSSDYDLVVVYSENVLDILAGHRYTANLPCENGVVIDGHDYDFSYMEVRHLVWLLVKGNINAFWAVLSPQVIVTSPVHKKIARYVRKYPTRAIMPSLEGMVLSNLSDTRKRATVRSPEKSLKTAMRTVQFGMNLYWKGEYMFEPVTG